ncbi:hypothetical protein, partial [Helicobacter sp. 13S00477-4]|uniref:hypothetical protein n=1 Tax=Helicobacter sp. 13S00477-4 TaxID=1905759 RepID=UPI00117A8B67
MGGGVSDLKATPEPDYNFLYSYKPKPNYSIKDIIEYNLQYYDKLTDFWVKDRKKSVKHNMDKVNNAINRVRNHNALFNQGLIQIINDYKNDKIVHRPGTGQVLYKNYFDEIKEGEINVNDIPSIQHIMNRSCIIKSTTNINCIIKEYDRIVRLIKVFNLDPYNFISKFLLINSTLDEILNKITFKVSTLSQAQQQAFKTIHNDQKKFSSLNAGVQRSAQMTNFISSLNTQTR